MNYRVRERTSRFRAWMYCAKVNAARRVTPRVYPLNATGEKAVLMDNEPTEAETFAKDMPVGVLARQTIEGRFTCM